MNVSIYSRAAILRLIDTGTFSVNTAVISFYDPPDGKRKSLGKVDCSFVADRVFYVAARDIDPPVLEQEGLTYADYFPEADDLAEFILQAEAEGNCLHCHPSSDNSMRNYTVGISIGRDHFPYLQTS